MKTVLQLALLVALAGCQAMPPHTPRVAALEDPESLESRGQKLAINRCSDCHSVDFAETSPLPQAPSFAAIANMPGLTPETLAQWMRDHRNYPDEMYFEIPAEHIEELSAYIFTLRRPEADRPG